MQQNDCSQLHTSQRRHLASISLFAYNFLISQISTIFGVYVDINNKKLFLHIYKILKYMGA